ncbi:unnamed protein product [Rangifer tarandus platyrhynchus]|uniref:Uncharacterized protein n=1 Tax=Rangifer tarandus platyrhynchus TaxID=3082113 RepID=A0ABN8Y6Y3_RANTA|nr:unnamed protein product [Rangifer tarandus platyrhynchus]
MGHTSGLEPGGSMEEACLGLPAWSQVTASGMLASKHSLHVRHWASAFPVGELLRCPADFDRTPQSPLTVAGSSAGLCTPAADSHGQLSPNGHNVGDLCEQKELGLADGPQSSTLWLRRNQGAFF